MELDPASLPARSRHLLLTGLVVPRPIAWVSTLAADGTANLAPYSFFALVSSAPPTVVVSVGSRAGVPKDTLANARATGELVVNVVGRELAVAMNATSIESAPDHDEFAYAGVTPAPSRAVRPPRVAEARAHLEARVTQIVPVPDDDGVVQNHVVFARVVHVQVDDALFTPPHRVDAVGLDPLARLAGLAYAPMGEPFELTRP
ncbi:MAG: flavin reductase family protein [Trueperaceae bacterium]|nr:flavin reductase family protein [Trueperaceae bacterium]